MEFFKNIIDQYKNYSHSLLKKERHIVSWLKEQKVNNFDLILDETYGFIVNVHGDVDLSKKSLKYIMVKFGHIKGDFNCSENKLTSLKGSPDTIHGAFNCSNNQLTSLQFCPQKLTRDYHGLNCSFNDIKDLLFFPQECLSYSYINLQNNYKLGKLQIVNSFDELYKEHQKQQILQKKEDLETKVSKVAPKTSPIFIKKI